ncbi:MAG: hypothetical protein L0215_20630 [Gemmataceae bacterium]|nr:hypothetical protein [Gemmataceae bacterium]
MSAPPAKAIITGVGAVTAVGLNALQTASSVRASVTRLGAMADICDEQGEPVTAARIPVRCRRRVHRASWLWWRAAREALASAGLFGRKDKPPIAVVQATPPADRPDCQNGAGKLRWPALEKALSRHVQVIHQESVPAGHAAVLLAMGRAMELLNQGACRAVLIGAADSLITIPALAWLDGCRRLKAAYAPAGFVPGEAAAALVMQRPESTPGQGVLAHCHEVASAREPVRMHDEGPALAKGLTEALRSAMQKAQLAPSEVEVVLCDLNGEPYRANEWCLARNRVLGRAGDIAVCHPADCLGDVGAASGGVLCVLAAVGFARGQWKVPRLLLFTASDSGERAAVCLTQPTPMNPTKN